MSLDQWVPFYDCSASFKIRSVAAEQTKGFHSVPDLCKAFCYSSGGDSAAFIIGVTRLQKAGADEISIQKRSVGFLYTDSESQIRMEAPLPLEFIGAEKAIGLSVAQFSQAAEGDRPSYCDPRDFWVGDINPAAVGCPRRHDYLTQLYGVPVGILDKKNDVIIVRPEIPNPESRATRAESILGLLPKVA